MEAKKSLTPKSKSLSDWYTEVIQQSELADYGPVRGTMVIRPYGYAIWENIQREFDKAVKRLGAENAYFPLFIPMSLLQREKAHIKGFSPELAVVTHGGGEKLKEPLAVRPTSETIMYEMYAKWISSWRDLPLKINQWNNVVRWEKRTYFFLRTLEFLWQEGHTAHANYAEAEKMAGEALLEYKNIYGEVFAMNGLIGVKSEAEKFAGAVYTYAIELLMPDGKILQGATSHYLGDNFAKPFDIKYQDKDGSTKYVHQTSWGLSTRSIGGMILTHGDDAGLIIPPKLAPIKAIIIPVLGKKDDEILKYCEKVKAEIDKIESKFPGKVVVDSDIEKTYGWKVNEAELKGIPVKISVGTRELYDKTLTFSDRLGKTKDKLVRASDAPGFLEELLSKNQGDMWRNSDDFLQKNIREAKTYEGFKGIMKTKRGFVKAFWCERATCEIAIKEETKATTRLKMLAEKEQKGKCIYCGRPAKFIWYFGQAY